MTLIDRLEAAEAGSRELDWLIAQHVGWTTFWSGYKFYLPPGEVEDSEKQTVNLPQFSQSVDAALTLIPEGWLLTLVGDLHTGFSATGSRCHLISWEHESDAEGSTRPLAICIAALRARSES